MVRAAAAAFCCGVDLPMRWGAPAALEQAVAAAGGVGGAHMAQGRWLGAGAGAGARRPGGAGAPDPWAAGDARFCELLPPRSLIGPPRAVLV